MKLSAGYCFLKKQYMKILNFYKVFHKSFLIAAVVCLGGCLLTSASLRTGIQQENTIKSVPVPRIAAVKPSSGDLFSSVSEIKATFIQNKDFSIYSLRKKSPFAVFAIHGGDIERGTSLLAEKTAGDDWSLYLFEGYGADAKKYHVTASRFDDPEALETAAAAILGISIHASRDSGEAVCVGGGNEAAAALASSRLSAAGFTVEYPCRRLPGKSPDNIVNRPALKGIQLELTQALLDRLAKEPEYLTQFTKELRKAAEDYMKTVP